MTERSGFRPGSALIIVLGMLSFMVVSAVGFSVYMRMSRQPSSYLRRASSSRYLLKSALAQALERLDGKYTSVTLIDDLAKSTDPDYDEDESELYNTSEDGLDATGYMEGVCDDPYPGLGPRLQGYSESENLSDSEKQKKASVALKTNGGYFDHRVLTPFGPVDKSKTVSTLTLEGLAYLPPAIINEARIFSRRTRTASWRNLAYEAGRYAFAAIDVSDLFDLNRVLPEPRTAGANSRIGFSSLFLTGSRWSDVDTSSGDQHPLGKLAPQGAVDTFLSMADFNVIAWGKDSGFSPFGKYVTQGGNVPQIQQNWLDTDAVRNALFITDTWFPDESLKNPDGTESSVTRYTLANDQPFDEYDERWGCEDILRAANSIPLGKLLRDRLGGVGFIALYDYLDRDNVPTSYALPTVETAPMVCALGLKAGDGGLKTRVARAETDQRKATVDLSAQNQVIEVVATPYTFTWGTDSLHVYGNVVFPFKRVNDKSANYATSFKVEGLVRVFLAPADLNSRLAADSPIIPRAQGDWANGEAGGILSAKVTMDRNPSFEANVENPADAVKPFEGTAELQGGDDTKVIFWEVVKTTYQIDPETGARKAVGAPVTYFSMDGITQSTNPLRTYDATGMQEGWLDELAKKARAAMFENGAKLTEDQLPAQAAAAGANIHDGSYVPHVAVWVRVENANGPFSGKTVDVVPAFATDDKVWGLHNESENEEVTIACAGEQPPVLRFSGKTDNNFKGFSYGISAVTELEKFDGAFGWSKLYAGEPRFNYAPEAWYSVEGGPETVVNDLSGWLQSVSAELGKDGRDGDIFMFTSDQECLQSMCELQFLPLTRDLSVAPGQIMENFAKFKSGYRFDGSASSVMDFMPGMWQTYSAPDGDPVYNAGDATVEIASSRGDFRVNPFTRDSRVLMSVFANTPYDWCVASTNSECNLSKNAFPDYSFALNHAFNSKTASAKLSDDVTQTSANASAGDGQAEKDPASDLEAIAEGFMEDMRNAVVKNWNGDAKTWPKWETLYDKLNWFGGGEKSLFGVELGDGSNPLHDVDRKFLHGFWRECFANRQQLYLIFLRAEPLSVGGGGKEALSCNQLGVHAVALVWRDPKPPYNGDANRAGATSFDGNKPPHQTRVLFFHQFD